MKLYYFRLLQKQEKREANVRPVVAADAEFLPKDLPDPEDKMASPVRMVDPEILEEMDRMEAVPDLVQRPHLASTVPLDHQDPQESPEVAEPQETPEELDSLEEPETQEDREHLDPKDHPERTVVPVILVHLVHLDNSDRPLDRKDHLDHLAHKDHQDPTVNQEVQELPVTMAHQDHPETTDSQEVPEHVVSLDRTENPDRTETRAAATTALLLALLVDIDRISRA